MVTDKGDVVVLALAPLHGEIKLGISRRGGLCQIGPLSQCRVVGVV